MALLSIPGGGGRIITMAHTINVVMELQWHQQWQLPEIITLCQLVLPIIQTWLPIGQQKMWF